MYGLEDFWWWSHVADFISLALAACLAIYGFILTQWPPPKTILRWFTVSSAFIASGVVFWNVIEPIPPHPRISVAVFMVLLTITTLKYRAGISAQIEHRRADD